MRILFRYQDTRSNQEDFALTPYLFLVYVNQYKDIKLRGLGFCWGFVAFGFIIGVNVPKEVKTFKATKRPDESGEEV